MLKDKKSSQQPSYPLYLIALPFLLGLLIRFVGLGQSFLDNVEANVALSIRDMVMGHSGVVTQPLYSQLTGVLFWLSFLNPLFLSR